MLQTNGIWSRIIWHVEVEKKTQPEINVRILIILKCKLMLILGVLLGFYALILGSCSYVYISGNYVAGNL